MIATGGSNVFIAAALRSGSTHLTSCLSKLLGLRMGRVNGMHGEGEEEQNVNPFLASILMPYGSFVFQQHTRCTSMNKQFIYSFDNRVVVLTRNLYDSLVSLREWSNIEDSCIIPGVPMPDDWREWEEFAQYRWLTYNAVPWYLSFVNSWLDKKVFWVDYDEHYSDQVSSIKNILNAIKVPLPEDKKIAAVASNRIHVRTGISGRGDRIFPEELRTPIVRQFGAWGKVEPRLREKLL